MIKTNSQLKEYIDTDALALGRTSCKPRLFGDEIWKFQISLRKMNYYVNNKTFKNKIAYLFEKVRYHHLSIKLGFTISPSTEIGKGLAIMHYGSLVINERAIIGDNCKIHNCVNIGATSGNNEAPIIGNNVYIGPCSCLIGNIIIADDVAIGAGAVVCKSIEEKNTTWGGVPAKMISQSGSHIHLSKELFR